jgi:AcrR family transcriptional regulator
MPSVRQQDVLDTACTLFYRDGFRATGIDRILAKSGAAKMTLYHHYASKEALIVAVLNRRDREVREHFAAEIERRAADPRARLLAVFDVLAESIKAPDFHGCMASRAAAEYGDPAHPVHAAAAEHKRRFFSWLRELARAAGAGRPYELAAQLMLLFDGAIVIAQVTGAHDAPAQARKAAESLIAAHTA